MSDPQTERRVVAFDHAPNFRDIGGYPTQDGRSVRWGALYRSSHLGGLSDADLKRFTELHIDEVFDLRRNSETESYPNRLPDGVTTYQLAIDVASTQYFYGQLRAGTATRRQATGALRESYRSYVSEFSPQFSQFLKRLSRGNSRAALVHCMVGKDRTGVAVALLMMALGVDRDAIMSDYLLSAEHYPARTIIDIIQQRLRDDGVASVEDSVLEPFATVFSEYLDAVFDEIDNQWGGPGGYLSSGLSLDDDDVELLRARFLI